VKVREVRLSDRDRETLDVLVWLAAEAVGLLESESGVEVVESAEAGSVESESRVDEIVVEVLFAAKCYAVARVDLTEVGKAYAEARWCDLERWVGVLAGLAGRGGA
jgi:hypothetical protein